MPIPYRDLANFNRSQFLSRRVEPTDTPTIDVCAAPPIAVTHTSWLFITTLGADAVGGVLSIVLLETVLLEDVTVEETVVLVSAAKTGVASTKHTTSSMIYFIIISEKAI
jgi:hypothetical protein